MKDTDINMLKSVRVCAVWTIVHWIATKWPVYFCSLKDAIASIRFNENETRSVYMLFFSCTHVTTTQHTTKDFNQHEHEHKYRQHHFFGVEISSHFFSTKFWFFYISFMGFGFDFYLLEIRFFSFHHLRLPFLWWYIFIKMHPNGFFYSKKEEKSDTITKSIRALFSGCQK